MSDNFEKIYSAEIVHAYKEVAQFAPDIPIDLFVSEFWEKGHAEHVGKSAVEDREAPYGGSTDAMQKHVENMRRIAISKVSQLLSSKSHDECKDIMRQKKLVHSSIMSSLMSMPGCRDPVGFLSQQGIRNPDARHNAECAAISEGIAAVWDGYKKKRLKSHDPEKFRRHFAKHMANSEDLVAQRRARKSQSVDSGMPPLKPAGSSMPALRKAAVSRGYGSFDNMPALRKVGGKQADDYSDMPPLRDISQPSQARIYADMPPLNDIAEAIEDDFYDSDSFEESMPSLRSSSAGLKFDSDEGIASDMPPLRSAAPYKKVGQPVPLDQGMPALRKVSGHRRMNSASMHSSSADMPTLRPIAAKPQPTASVSSLIAVGWMEKYIQKHKRQLTGDNFIYFAPSNARTERVLNSLEAMGQRASFNEESFVKTHLCEDAQPGKDIGNKSFNPIRDEQNHLILVDRERKIKIPSVTNPELKEDGQVIVEGISVRVFVHDNIFNFTK
jgi:hypothetical protein